MSEKDTAPKTTPETKDAPAKNWRKLEVPKPWKPEVGEVLEGLYLGARVVEGMYGQYKQHLVRATNLDNNNVLFLTGVVCDSFFALILPPTQVKAVFLGLVENSKEGAYKNFDLYVRED